MVSKSIVFLAVIALFVYSLFAFEVMRWIVGGLFGLFLVYLFYRFFVRKYSQHERGVILRFGRFNRIAGPGWSIVLPFLEREMAKIDIRTHQMSITIPEVFTEREIRLKVSGFAYYKVVDPKKAVLEIDNYQRGLRNILVGTLRDLISSMSLTEIFTNIEDINKYIQRMARRRWQSWGIEVPNIQLVKISPPQEVISAMQRQKIAKEDYQAKRLNAEAKRIVIEALGEGAKSLDDPAIMYLYLQALKDIGGKGTEMILPSGFSQSLGEVGSQMFGEGSKGGLGAMGGLTLTEAIDRVKDTMQKGGVTESEELQKKIQKKTQEKGKQESSD